MDDPEQKSTDGSKSENFDLPLFDFATIACATENFSNKNGLGQGGFGQVYKVSTHKHCYIIPWT